MGTFSLDQPSLKTIAIRVKDREAMIHFYRDIIGFHLIREENELAILGYKEPETEFLWLEESPRAEDHTGEIKKMQRFSLVVPNEEELANVWYRAQKFKFPLEDALIAEEDKGLLFADPEGNEIEVFFGASKVRSEVEPSSFDLDELLKKATKKEKIHGAYFDKIHLNVSDLTKQIDFITNTLGLPTHEEKNELLVLNRGNFVVGLSQATGGTIDLPTEKVLGLDFLMFKVSQTELEKLAEHLSTIDHEHFIDKKRTIITVYDAIGIEWWFVLA
ncbi:VOC family protein [Enterococcus sp. CSURQ0835]|uniref:VOC family protein n=1 Tax=Enterococcus sp. CSURQ0835 TaxID=2681394 RepID=UPI00135749E8|nr:VOC family protein [Enterococcus sp. CSURQ0835]